jgi:hypothetical protein
MYDEKETKDDDKYEVECLARKIEEVEYCKQKKPELYSKAVAELKGKAKVISSIDDIKVKRQKLAAGEDEKDS